MEHKDDIQKELENIAPFLSKMTKKDPFEAPHGYFEMLPSRISDIVRESRKPSLLQTLLSARWVTALSAGMAVVLVAIIFFVSRQQITSGIAVKPHSSTVVSPAGAIAEVPVDAYIDELDAETLETALADNMGVKTGTALQPEPKKAIDKKAIENYLIENTDEQLLQDEL